ncbi:hypothetical protein MCGE09_00495, partial [Thaumarchaeota archaeon SCGC AB-539-E09]
MNEKPYEYMETLKTLQDPWLWSGKELQPGWESPEIAEPRIPTMDKKLIIEAAIPGWIPTWWFRKYGIKNLPPGGDGGPTCIQEQADAMVECVKAGAAAIHTHPRHPSDGLTRIHAPKVLTSTMDAAFEEVDFITAHHTWDFNLRHSWETDYISNP